MESRQLYDVERLGRLPLLHDLSLPALEALVRTVTYRHHLSRGAVLPAPARSEVVDLVVAGQVHLAYLGAAGQMLTMELLGPGGFLVLGGAQVAGEERWMARALATATLIYEWPVPVVEAVLVDAPVVALAVLREQHWRLIRAYTRLGELGCAPLCERLACTLARLAPADGGLVALSQEELGWLVGASRDRVTKALAQLRLEGLVDMARGQRGVRVRDAVTLRRYVETR